MHILASGPVVHGVMYSSETRDANASSSFALEEIPKLICDEENINVRHNSS